MVLDEAVTINAQHKEIATIPHQKEEDDAVVAEITNRRGHGVRTIKLCISVAMLGAVFAVLAFNYNLSELLSDLRALSLSTIAVIFVALLANVLVATLRFKTIVADMGHSIYFRSAMATVSASTLAGAIFFQFAGQLIARGAFMGRAGIPFADVVVITAYERIVSAVVSALLALAGAYYIFGTVYLDRNLGGAELIRISCGLVAATALGALFGYGRMAVRSITPLLTLHFTQRSLRVIGLTVLVQLPIMIAYVVAAKALSTDTAVPSLIAASTVVMFAASVPISLAGWGVREMSAIAALGAIGVTGHAAFTAAALVGIGSLLATGVIAVLSLPNTVTEKKRKVATPAPRSIDYARALSWFLPLASATLVLFQIYMPIGSGLLNINLADPLALMGGAFFVLSIIKQREIPKWRVPYINVAVAFATLVLTAALLIGEWRFGWTTWAWVNRFLGWFVLLGYGTTGALIATKGSKETLALLLLTFVGAVAAIAGVDIGLSILRDAGFQSIAHLVPLGEIQGFSQNRNSFALQLLIAISAIIVFARDIYVRVGLLTLMLTALWCSGSRSGWIALVCLVATALYLHATHIREIVTATFCAAGIALVSSRWSAVPAIFPSNTSTQERLTSLRVGLRLFAEHPIFGAGLGAFHNEKIPGDGALLVIHSTPVWLLAELGIIGFLAFAVPASYVFFTEWRYSRKDQASAIIVLCFIAFAVMSGPADMLYQRSFWLVIGAALAVTPSNASGRAARRFNRSDHALDAEASGGRSVNGLQTGCRLGATKLY